MPLTPGTTLGPYEILSPIGAGGMGEVYKARDTRLDRTVAIKVPEHVASDPDLKQRFEREAKTISSLNLTPCKRRSAETCTWARRVDEAIDQADRASRRGRRACAGTFFGSIFDHQVKSPTVSVCPTRRLVFKRRPASAGHHIITPNSPRRC